MPNANASTYAANHLKFLRDLETKLRKRWIVRSPIIKESKVAHKSSGERELFPISMIPAPKIAGMESKKENRIALFSSRPLRSPAESVVPERDIPGRMATAWARPTRKASGKEGVRLVGGKKSELAMNKTRPVMANPRAVMSRLEKNASM